MFKNWKSTMAFFVFVIVYVYTVYKESSDMVVEVAGYVALWSSLFMMLRNEFTSEIVSKLVDKIDISRK